MHETSRDFVRLQRLLDGIYEKAGQRLRSIITPGRRLNACQVCDEWFGAAENSVRFRHLRTRPPVSATHTRDEELGVTVHGIAHEIDKASGKYDSFRDCLREVYGPQWDSWGYWDSAPFAWIAPRVMFAVTFKQARRANGGAGSGLTPF